VPTVTYTGYLAVSCPDYIDTDTGMMLAVSPGGTYNIQVIGCNVPDVPSAYFTED
jgi:hypothetical protein